MRDPFPFATESLSATLRDFYTEYRRLNPKPQDLDTVRSYLAENVHKKYMDESEMNDTLDMLYTFLEICADEEIDLHRQDHAEKQRKAKLKKSEKTELPYAPYF